VQVEFGDRILYDCGKDNYPAHPIRHAECRIIQPRAIQSELKLTTDVQQWPWEAFVLVAMLVSLRFQVYLVLRYRKY